MSGGGPGATLREQHGRSSGERRRVSAGALGGSREKWGGGARGDSGVGVECSEGPRELSEENRGSEGELRVGPGRAAGGFGEHHRGTGGNTGASGPVTAGVQGSTGNLGRVSEEALTEDREEQWG